MTVWRERARKKERRGNHHIFLVSKIREEEKKVESRTCMTVAVGVCVCMRRPKRRGKCGRKEKMLKFSSTLNDDNDDDGRFNVGKCESE
jgi:hypothetical protein